MDLCAAIRAFAQQVLHNVILCCLAILCVKYYGFRIVVIKSHIITVDVYTGCFIHIHF